MMQQATRYPRRPPRLTRVWTDAPLYFVTFTTHQRQNILACSEIHDAFVQFAREAGHRGVAVGRYVIMPNHIHLFVRLPRDARLTCWVQALRAVLGKMLIRLGHVKPHWQEGFFDHVLRNDENYEEKGRYVAMNPVRAGLVARAEDWPYQGVVVLIRW